MTEKVLLLWNIHIKAKELFENEWFGVDCYNNGLDRKSLLNIISQYTVLWVRSNTVIDNEIIETGIQLKVIAWYCTGIEKIDKYNTERKWIKLLYSPFWNGRSVAELTVGNMIALARKSFEKSSNMHQWIRDKNVDNAMEILWKKIWIIWYGNIGQQVGIISEALGMNVFYYDIRETISLGKAIACKDMDTLLKQSDIVTLHVNGGKENKNLISEQQISKMKQWVILLNMSRWNVINESALVRAVRWGKISWLSLDVFCDEPNNIKDNFSHPLQWYKNVILTPHIWGNTKERQLLIAIDITQKALGFLSIKI